LQKVLAAQELRKSPVKRGMSQAAKFSRKQAAEKTIEVYREAE